MALVGSFGAMAILLAEPLISLGAFLKRGCQLQAGWAPFPFTETITRYLSALLSAQGAWGEHLNAGYCALLFMGHASIDGAASRSPLRGGCAGP